LTAADSSVAEAIISKAFATVPPAFNGMVFALLYNFIGMVGRDMFGNCMSAVMLCLSFPAGK
jgi:hypothetical protein